MRFTNRILMMALLVAGLFAVSVDGYCWGQKGHDVTCAVAQRHLTRKAARKIDEILDGKTIVYWANWMDNASHTPEYRYTSSWHYRNTDEGETFSGVPLNENGDVVRAVNEQIAALKSGKLDKEEQALSLKFLVHLMGDLHCPMHMGHRSDRGGNRWQVQFFNNGTNLHSIWDTGIIESAHKWTYSEWVEQIDTNPRAENRKMAEGTPESWGEETYGICRTIYASTPVGSKLSYDYVGEWTGTVEVQLLRGGLRLAAVLNDIFG